MRQCFQVAPLTHSYNGPVETVAPSESVAESEDNQREPPVDKMEIVEAVAPSVIVEEGEEIEVVHARSGRHSRGDSSLFVVAPMKKRQENLEIQRLRRRLEMEKERRNKMELNWRRVRRRRTQRHWMRRRRNWRRRADCYRRQSRKREQHKGERIMLRTH
ncbi:hypothetical protein PENTCL1PPCAC_7324 [Pristionchus entomophagus]|uniref:BZIP domain-containing protein n=1 Tax=Pristionchus entomophagus TaxID=358040 RepID=A0AAV5SY21_9BILA|nr:hypothetical protein PENTCL1PPCAC_7324 [Pristionchus entomophagus]